MESTSKEIAPSNDESNRPHSGLDVQGEEARGPPTMASTSSGSVSTSSGSASTSSGERSSVEELGVQKFGPLGSYHRGVAVRMLTDYLKDLESLNVSAGDVVRRRLMEYRVALNNLKIANELEPNSRLTVKEREMVKRMLRDYYSAMMGDPLQLDSFEPPDESRELQGVSEGWMTRQNEETRIFVMNLSLDTGMDEVDWSSWRPPNELGGNLDENFNPRECLQLLGIALKRCELEVHDISQRHSHLKVFKLQCVHLANTLASIGTVKFHQFWDMFKQIDTVNFTTMDVSTRQDWSKGLTFCMQSLVELERMLHLVKGILSMCSDRQWWRIAVKMANIPPDPKIPRWSSFALSLQKCEWALDIVELSFQVLKTLITADAIFDLKNVAFDWSEDRRRLVLELNSEPSKRKDIQDEPGVLKVALDLETKDRLTLLEQLKEIANIRGWKRSEVEKQYLLATFLMQKLGGPTPQAEYLPYSCRIDPPNLKFREYMDSGSFGMVALCHWLGEKVAVKHVNVSIGDRQKFEVEAGILGKVQHPNVVQLIGYAYKDKKEVGTGTGMLVMELMEHDLRSVIDKRRQDIGLNERPFSLVVAIDIMLQIAEAMLYLRAHGVLHRDLKAKNILINSCQSQGKTLSEEYRESLISSPHLASLFGVEDYYIVKLADFGLAKCRLQTSFRTMVGTTPWRAPEIFKAKDHELSADYKWPADVYSFGMTCYEILTGRVPFENVEQASIQTRITTGERPILGGSAPGDLTQLIEACWHTNPDNRPDFSEISKRLWRCRLEIIIRVLKSFHITRSSSIRRGSM